MHHFLRAADQDGVVLDILIQGHRNTAADKRFSKCRVARHYYKPRPIVTGGLRSYEVAQREVLPHVWHRTSRHLHNQVKNWQQATRRRERWMQRFKFPEQAQRFLSSQASSMAASIRGGT